MASPNGRAKDRTLTTNRSGHAAYSMDDETRLVTMALTTMLGEPKFYGDNTDEMMSLAEGTDPTFVAKLAVWARTRGNMRSVSHALVCVAARNMRMDQSDHTTPSPIRAAARAIASQRGDDGTEIVAAWKALYGGNLPNALRRGIRDALEHATPYSLAKYQSRSREVKLRDTLRITHPNPSPLEVKEAMGKVVSGSLAVPEGWETELSKAGNDRETWDRLLSEGKVGIFAAVRNLRNIVGSGADVTPVIRMLEDPEAVARSRMLPFRFHTAYMQLARAGFLTTRISRALDSAMASACGSVSRLPGRTAVLVNVSGSMGATISSRSVVRCEEIAAVLAAMASHVSDDAIVIQFAGDASVVPMTGNSILSDAGLVRFCGGSTNMRAGFDVLSSSGFDADRVIVLSDNEVNSTGWGGVTGHQVIQSCLDSYRAMVGHDVWCHGIDLQGYGTQQFRGPRFNCIAGWSEQVLRFVAMAESGLGGIVEEVRNVAL